MDAFARGRLGPNAHPRPLGTLRFWLVSQDVAGVQQVFEPNKELLMKKNPSGYYLFFAEEKLPDGSKRALALPDGNYQILVTSRFYQSVEKEFVLPMPNLNQDLPDGSDPMLQYSLDLEPNYAYPFPNTYPLRFGVGDDCADVPSRQGPTLLRGSLHTKEGQGLAGASVQVVGTSNVYKTDETGQWVLWFPNDYSTKEEKEAVRVDLPDGSQVDVADVCVVKGRETSLAETALRGHVTKAGKNVEGATVKVAEDSVETDKDGKWFYYFDLNQGETMVNVVASLPDGGTPASKSVQVRPRSTIVVPTFKFQ